MNALVWTLLLAMLATVATLVTGIRSMAGGNGCDARPSRQWMALGVVFQAVAVALLLVRGG